MTQGGHGTGRGTGAYSRGVLAARDVSDVVQGLDRPAILGKFGEFGALRRPASQRDPLVLRQENHSGAMLRQVEVTTSLDIRGTCPSTRFPAFSRT